MEAKELRITNLVKYKGFECAVTAIDLVDIRISRFKDEKKQSSVISIVNVYDDLKPIPLTEEWLLKFGFDNLGAYGWGISYFHIRFRNIHKFYFPIENRIVRIEYVHQLQNLYFALTGKELTKASEIYNNGK